MNNVTTSELISKGFSTSDGKWSYNGKLCVLDFYADWCIPCKQQEQVLNDMNNEYLDIDFYKINIEEEYELAEMFSIKSLPTVMFCGKEITQFTGFAPKQKIETFLKNQIEILA